MRAGGAEMRRSSLGGGLRRVPAEKEARGTVDGGKREGGVQRGPGA
jgi:hypothetical protein